MGLKMILDGATAPEPAAIDASKAAAWALALRQSVHSDATVDPNEKPLKFLPHCGQIGIPGFPFRDQRFKAGQWLPTMSPRSFPIK
jgi:hypothetical protein